MILCVSVAWVAPSAPSGHHLNVSLVPSTLVPASPTHAFAAGSVPVYITPFLALIRADILWLSWFYCPSLPLRLPTVFIAVLRTQLSLAPRKYLTDTHWTTEPHCICRTTITSLFSSLHGSSCPLVSMEIRSRTSCRHQSPWMLRLLP